MLSVTGQRVTRALSFSLKNSRRRLACAIETLESRQLLSDVSFAVGDKGINYRQVATSAPVLDGSTPYEASLFVMESGSNTVSSGEATFPGGAVHSLTSDGQQFKFGGKFASQALMDASAPDGVYGLEVTGVNDGPHTFVLNVVGDQYPAAPMITNANAVLKANPTTPLTVTWNPMSNGTVNDYIRIEVWDDNGDSNAYHSPDPGAAGALNGTATSAVIPAGIFAAGGHYEVDVTFVKMVSQDTVHYPGVSGYGVYTASLSFEMLPAVTGVTATQGGSAGKVWVSWNQLQDSVGQYQVMRSTSNDPASATAVGTVLAGSSSTYTYKDTTPAPGVQYYYWVRATNSQAMGQFGTAATGFSVLPAPTGLAAGPGPNNMRVTWAPVPNAASYAIFRGTDSNPADATKIATSTTSSYVDSGSDLAGGLAVGTMYYYWVRASNSVTTSTKSITFASAEAYLAAPTGLHHASGRPSKQNVTFAWDAVTGAVKYQLYVSNTANFAKATLVNATTLTSLLDPTAAIGKFYWVRAKTAAGWGFASAAYQYVS